MKKSLLLVLMFITMFFVGSNEAFAYSEVKCDVDGVENGKSCLDRLKENLEEKNAELLCLYEVQYKGYEEKYYNYIYSLGETGTFYGGTTLEAFNSNKKDLKLTEDSNPYIMYDSYSKMVGSYQCPSNSYFEPLVKDKPICFDENGDCLNITKGKDFSKSISKLIEEESDTSLLRYKEITPVDFCSENKISEIGNFTTKCSYYNSKFNNYIILLYDNNQNNKLLYLNYKEGYNLVIDYNQTGKVFKYDNFDNVIQTYTYTNKISSPINSCPSNIYLSGDTKLLQSTSNTYFTLESNDNNNEFNKYTLFKDCSKLDGAGDKVDIDGCDDLINEELREVIDTIMGIIRIGVPILLIGLIIYDFAMATFSAEDKNIEKIKQRAIKRVIIAIIIFFVPFLVNFIFDIVNEIWGTNFGTCGIE